MIDCLTKYPFIWYTIYFAIFILWLHYYAILLIISRSTTETLPLPKIHQQEESKMYKLASQKGFTDEEIAKTLKTFHSKRAAMYNAKHINYPPNPGYLGWYFKANCRNARVFFSWNMESFWKLGGAVKKPNPNIWWFIELIKSENTHYTMKYYRLRDGYDIKGFIERKRDSNEIQKDLELTKLKNRYLKNEFDAIELNKRVSFYMHDYILYISILFVLIEIDYSLNKFIFFIITNNLTLIFHFWFKKFIFYTTLRSGKKKEIFLKIKKFIIFIYGKKYEKGIQIHILYRGK